MLPKTLRKSILLGLISVAVPLASAVRAEAAELDLTNGMVGTPCTEGGSLTNAGTVCQGYVTGGQIYYKFAGALWSTSQLSSTGTGVIDSFVRIQDSSSSVVDGHNTSGSFSNQEKSGSFTHDVLTSQVGTKTVDGVSYYEFLLDINQTGSDPLIALSGLKLCGSTTGSLSFVDDCGPSSTLRYNMDAVTDVQGTNTVLLDYSDNAGSGSGDLFVYIPTSLMPVNSNNTYLYLWSQFGLRGNTVDSRYDNNDGYEEWAFMNTQGGTPSPFNVGAPEPATLIMLGTGLLLGGGAIRRRTRKQAGQS